MVTPVRASSQVAEIEQPSTPSEDQGSYPAEITREQFVWLQERADARRREWAAHAASLACNQKS